MGLTDGLCAGYQAQMVERGWARKRRGLYAIVDPDHCGGRDPATLAESILRGGCAVLQLRAKGLPDRDALSLGRALAALCARYEVPFVMNDRVDVALLCDAEGAHLGQDDLPLEAARRIGGEALVIGQSTHDPEQARRAKREGADLIGYGPVYPTRTKERPDPVVGVEGLGAICEAVDLPVVAIGGVTEERVPAIAAAGAQYWAAISAVTGAADVEDAARRLHRAGG